MTEQNHKLAYSLFPCDLTLKQFCKIRNCMGCKKAWESKHVNEIKQNMIKREKKRM